MAEGRRDGGWERELNDPPLKLPSNRHRNAAAYYLCVAADTEPSLRSRRPGRSGDWSRDQQLRYYCY